MALPGCNRCKLFCVVLAFAALVHGESPATGGFISIDCGMPDGKVYTDEATKIDYKPDKPYIDTGDSKTVQTGGSNNLAPEYGTVRSFPDGTRNCYNLPARGPGGKYLIRAGFWYGNYDGKDSAPVFDLYIGVNYWATVDRLSPDRSTTEEVITVAQGVSIWVCLVNTGKGTPFISVLELRPLLDSMYPVADQNHSLVLHQNRVDYGGESQSRYGDDPYDRIWLPAARDEVSQTLATRREVTPDGFQVPSSVLRTAVTTGNLSHPLYIRLDPARAGEMMYVIMHFAEVEQLRSGETRQMDIHANGPAGSWSLYENYSPGFLKGDHLYGNVTVWSGRYGYNLTISAANTSTRPPLINAMESYLLRSMDVLPTDPRDADAMQDMKRLYNVKRNWMGDPCAPKEFVWDGVVCSYEDAKPPRIIMLNLGSSGLNNEIAASIANLTALTDLDLSNNSLTGTIPDFLGHLPSLKILNVSGNQLTIPRSLCEKVVNDELLLSTEGNPTTCPHPQVTERRKIYVTVVVVASSIVLVLLVISIILWRIIRRRPCGAASRDLPKGQQKEDWAQSTTTKENNGLKRESYQFTSSEIIKITQNYEMTIGKGGFGNVYLGHLDDGTKVAVKVLSKSSSQGAKEFQAEAILLTRVHHRNLVSLLGYCNDEYTLALVYEYMQQGTLQDHLSAKIDDINILGWEARVKIALQAAQGLDYLHNGCKPPIVHRDVKSSNILLNHNFVAKLADFGLSRAFKNDDLTHISTAVAGTLGYLDPEYYQTYKLTEKSDVYGFGIVLLEVVTGQPIFVNGTEKTHIVQWVHSRLKCGDINSIVDSRLDGNYDINSVWKVLEIAMACTVTASVQRLTMSNVVSQLKECLVQELDHEVLDDFDGAPTWNSFEVLPLRVNSGCIPIAR